jgi:lambda repressor-like predicted transcriptional regulator
LASLGDNAFAMAINRQPGAGRLIALAVPAQDADIWPSRPRRIKNIAINGKPVSGATEEC